MVCVIVASIGITVAAKETVYLKNGSVIKGDVIEQIPGQSLKVRTSDGSLFVYSMDDVERITKEEITTPDANGHRGLDFGIDAGVDIMKGVSHCPVELVLSKRINKNISLGLGAGANFPTSGGGKPSIPVFVDFKGLMPLTSTKMTPFIDIRGGYMISVEKNYSDLVLASVMPGIRIPMSSRTDLDFGLGYMMYAPTKGGDISNAFAIRLGLNFHKSTNPNPAPKIFVPTRNTGFEFGFDAYGGQDLGGNLFAGYRLSKKLSLGFGVGYGKSTSDVNANKTRIIYSGPDCTGEILNEYSYSEDYDLMYLKFFLRGEYRFIDKKFSPFAALDLGFHYGHWHWADSNGVYGRPSVGVSWRCTNNSYLQLHVDYELSTGGIEGYQYIENEKRWINGRYQEISECRTRDGKKFCPFSVGITWKRTFSLFSRD